MRKYLKIKVFQTVTTRPFMMITKRYATFLALSMIIVYCYGQPGGPGGIYIDKFFDDKFEPINIYNDTNIKIRTFQLMDDKTFKETFLFEKAFKKYDENRRNHVSGSFYFPGKHDKYTARMYIIYKSDTMIVDFIGIIPSNASDHRNGIDSVVIKNGYSQYDFYKWYSFNYFFKKDSIDLTFLPEVQIFVAALYKGIQQKKDTTYKKDSNPFRRRIIIWLNGPNHGHMEYYDPKSRKLILKEVHVEKSFKKITKHNDRRYRYMCRRYGKNWRETLKHINYWL